MDGGAWWAAVHGVTRSWTRLSDFTFTFHFHALEKEMATHSSVRAWRIPGTGEPGGLPSLESHRVGHNWSDLAAAANENIEKLRSEVKTIKRNIWRNCFMCRGGWWVPSLWSKQAGNLEVQGAADAVILSLKSPGWKLRPGFYVSVLWLIAPCSRSLDLCS